MWSVPTNAKHRPQVEATTWPSRILLLLLLCWKGVYVSGCPGVERNGLHYVTTVAELWNERSCYYSTSGAHYDESNKIISEFTCDHRSGNDCHGFLINPDYVFWNDTVKDFIPAPSCEANVSSCSDLGNVCMQTSSKTCKKGEFVCKSKETQDSCLGSVVPSEPSDVVECPETVSSCEEVRSLFPSCECENTDFKCWDDYQECKGKIVHPLDMTCPPDIVYSYDEVKHYCTKGSSSSGTSYKCSWYGETVCTGNIDTTLQPPSCHHNISSCSKEEYFGLCEQGEYFMNCDSFGHITPQFQCVDKESGQWCEAHIVPSYGSWENPTCPDEEVSCEVLGKYGLSGCNCGTFNGEGTFECKKDGNPWCSGKITSKHPVDHSPPEPVDDTTGNDITLFASSNDELRTDNHTRFRGHVHGSLVVGISVVAVAAVLIERLHRRKRLVAGRTILATDECDGHIAMVDIPDMA